MCVGSVDRRVESEESGDEEGKKHGGSIVADLSQQSLKDGVEQVTQEGTGLSQPGTHPTGTHAVEDCRFFARDVSSWQWLFSSKGLRRLGKWAC